ncbi:MAG: phosphatase PAP2 family protein [Thermoleophilia bacterium]|nr:phosphatase PAP2 family protein [Thermoleophilia bacterium]
MNATPLNAPVLPVFATNSILDTVRGQIVAELPTADTAVASYLVAHSSRNDAAFEAFSEHQLSGPPSAGVQSREFSELHQLQDGRTAPDTSTATFYDKNGQSNVWQNYLTAWQRTVPAAQAKAGARLLSDALTITGDATKEAKRNWARTRPYAADSSLKPIVVDPMDAQHSYPSGHVSSSFAAAAVLAHLMPDRAAEFEQTAEQVAFARIYSVVHFPSDVVAGAQLGRMVGDYAISLDGR